ncbi:MAG TPA: protein kinase [Thermoanaerobaculia bacterium]|nr:protein kinase [Thermoanaerobaculia bacterium]
MLVTPGTRVRRYEVGDSIGAGGMGEVYVARDVELERTVALKILPGDAAADPDRIRRFVQEAKAACALNHPNVAHIYDVGEENGIRFMAMEYVEGETLRRRLARSRVPIDAALDIVMQTASALASAHDAGVVHRDIKPENVMLRPDGYVKVLDFGLAKLVGTRASDANTALSTAPGMVMGTMHYMSPEQLRGESVDARTDVFSLGILLYELLSGVRPFEASSPSGVIAAILTEEPKAIDDAPPELRAVIAKALAKKRDDRYASATEMLDDLKRARHESTMRLNRSGDLPTQILQTAPLPKSRRPFVIIALVVIVVAIGTWLAIRANRIRNARASIARVEQLAEQRKFFEAYDLGQSIRGLVGSDERLIRAIDRVTIEVSFNSAPAGARVWLRRFVRGDEQTPRVLAGVTPLPKLRIPQGDYFVTIEKDGYAPADRPLMAQPVVMSGLAIPIVPPQISVTLLASTTIPPGMVSVPGSTYRLAAWSRTTLRPVPLDSFFIDRYEVSNRDFARFINAGGYRIRDFWKIPFVKDGKTLTFEEAMTLFHDATGLAGPRGWAGQKYPQGRENDPVTEITWYEAAAYAEWAGKKLPTVYEWDKAAKNGSGSWMGTTMPWGIVADNGDALVRANFRGNGPMPVDSLPFGISPFGAYHMAGNVSEWCRNPTDEGFAATGGGFEDAIYRFGSIGAYPPFYTSHELGFRCVKETASGNQGGFPLRNDDKVPDLKPAGDAAFAELARFFEYPNAPLDARVVETKTTDEWTRETISYAGADGKRVTAFLYLPKSARRPLQVIHFAPAADVVRAVRPLDQSMEQLLAPFIRGGRAAFGVMLEGFIGRPNPSASLVRTDIVDRITADVTDIRRGLDYLATRKDLDMKGLALFGQSAGAATGLIVAGVDHRYGAVFLSGLGLTSREYDKPPAANRINFASRIRGPLLLLQGKYDESHPFRTDAEPLYRIFAEPKELVLYEGGHVAPSAVLIPTVTKFYDRALGPVR